MLVQERGPGVGGKDRAPKLEGGFAGEEQGGGIAEG